MGEGILTLKSTFSALSFAVGFNQRTFNIKYKYGMVLMPNANN